MVSKGHHTLDTVLTLPFIGLRWILHVGASKKESPLAFASRASNPPAWKISSLSNVAPMAVSQGMQVAGEGLKWLEPRIPFWIRRLALVQREGKRYVQVHRYI